MSEIELCVRCGKPTPYLQSTPIALRRYFVEGAGQLCPACWKKLYGFPGSLDDKYFTDSQSQDK